MLRWVPVAGALGRFVERLIAYLAAAAEQKVEFSSVFAAHSWETLANLFIAGLVTATSAIFLDLNRQNHARILASGFVMGAIYPALWQRLLLMAEELAKAVK